MPWKNTSVREQRWNFIREYLRRKSSVAELCRRCGISRKTAYKWIRRFRDRGRFGLGDHTRRPHRIHNRPDKVWLARIRRWRAKHPTWGAAKLRWALARRFRSKRVPSEAAISRWLKEWHLTRRRRRYARRGPTIDRPQLRPAVKPNDVWTVDYKGCFYTSDGTRVEPLTVRDSASRYVLKIPLGVRLAVEENRVAFQGIFRKYGLPRRIRCDNGTPFGATGVLGLTRLSAWWVKLGIEVEFIEPGHPEQNGAHEQLHRVYKAETANPPAQSLPAQRARTERWRKQYNEQRPHEALKMRVPADLYTKSRRRAPHRLKQWHYNRGWESRLVKGKGMISFKGQSRFVGEAFERDRVGLKPIRAGIWEVYFGPLLIGELWESEAGAIRSAHYRRSKVRR